MTVRYLQRFDARQLMERAIAVMGRSVAEPRSDGKASPKVGAVLFLNGDIQEAARGELRYGDHAEFTLLERKNRDKPLDGAKLFATLEPCAPGSRRHPKLGCAERIVLARIKEVWIGIEDPDPTVDRKGIKYLQENGVTVHMFDRDLQEKIREANREFLEQALERAAAVEEEKKPIVLSALENPFANSRFSDFSSLALDVYSKATGMRDWMESPQFRRRLALQGLLREEGEQWVPTGFGLLLLGEEPRLHMPQAGLLGTIHFADGREELRNFDGPQVLAPEQALQWLRDKLPDPADRSEARRKSANSALFELAREGIVNAIVHRDYGIEGAKCQLIATPDTITIKSPGMLLSPITLEQMQSFTAPMLSRNPILHYVFSQMDLAEERGLGLKSMKQRAEEAGLPLPVYAWEDPYLVLTLYRSSMSVVQALAPNVLAALNEDERAGWEFVTKRSSVTSGELAKALSFDEKKAQRILKKLIQVKLVQRIGKGPATYYEVVRG